MCLRLFVSLITDRTGGVHGHLGLSGNSGVAPGAPFIERPDRTTRHSARLQLENGQVPAACAHRRHRLARGFRPGVAGGGCSVLSVRFVVPLPVFISSVRSYSSIRQVLTHFNL